MKGQSDHHPTDDPFPWQTQACVMGVINRSPDSFFAPQASLAQAIDDAARMCANGAAILDIGGEATNPQVNLEKGPSIQQELDRLLPTIEAFQSRFDVMLSIDTSQTEVMAAVLAAGADMINDQRALRADGAKQVVAKYQVPVCVMHFPQGREPGSATCTTLLTEVMADLLFTAQSCLAAGIAAEHIILDPGFGQGHYAKNTQENFFLLSHLNQFVQQGYPVLVGWSRKSMIGDVLDGAAVDQRLFGSIAAALFAAHRGASILRVHDVRETVEALKIWQMAERSAEIELVC